MRWRIYAVAAVIVAGMLFSLLFVGDAIDRHFDGPEGLETLRSYGDWAWLAGIGLIISDLVLPVPATTIITLLGMVGFVTRVCHDAAAALAAAGSFRPEACVLDVTMPGMDGCELARTLRAGEGGRELLLVAVTALGDEAALKRTSDAGFDLHLTKPADPQRLADALFAFERKLRVG